MADYLYNGVGPLPKLPESKLPYAFMKTVLGRDGTVAYRRLYRYSSNAYYTQTETGLYFGGDPYSEQTGEKVAYEMYQHNGNAWELRAESESNSTLLPPPEGYTADGITQFLTWANFDVEYNGTLYLAASDPVPFYGWETLWDGKPEKDGGVDGDNGDFFWLWYSSEGNKNRLSIGDTVRVTVDGTVSTLTVSAGANDKFAEAGNEWLKNNSATDDGTDIYFWEYNGALRFFTREMYYDEMPHVKFERAITVSPVKINPALLVQSFFTGQAIRRNRT